MATISSAAFSVFGAKIPGSLTKRLVFPNGSHRRQRNLQCPNLDTHRLPAPRWFSVGCPNSKTRITNCIPKDLYMDVSKNRGTPKWMVYNGKPYWNGWFGVGVPLFLETPIYIYIQIDTYLVIQSDLFGMVKTWPFKGRIVTSNWGIKRSRLESPGTFSWFAWTYFWKKSMESASDIHGFIKRS